MADLTIQYSGKIPTLSWLPRIPFPSSYRVSWSPGPDGPWMICDGASEIAVLQYTDVNADRYFSNHNRVYWKVTAMVGGVEVDHCPATYSSQHARESFVQRIADEIIRRHLLVLDKFSGEQCDLYLRRHAGTPCPNHKQVGDGSRNEYAGPLCPVCYNTGITGGFVKKSNVLIRTKNITDQIALSNEGMTIIQSVGAWTGPYPILATGDFYVRPGGQRLGISTVRQRQMQGEITIQVMGVERIEPSHPFWTINL